MYRPGPGTIWVRTVRAGDRPPYLPTSERQGRAAARTTTGAEGVIRGILGPLGQVISC